eukprot:scaffold17996_cov194-Amphora_coffeaeformis.AAC.15
MPIKVHHLCRTSIYGSRTSVDRGVQINCSCVNSKTVGGKARRAFLFHSKPGQHHLKALGGLSNLCGAKMETEEDLESSESSNDSINFNDSSQEIDRELTIL